MAIPNDIAVIDTMIGLPSVERRDWQESMAAVLRDKASRGFHVYTSSEVDILADGSMDYPDLFSAPRSYTATR